MGKKLNVFFFRNDKGLPNQWYEVANEHERYYDIIVKGDNVFGTLKINCFRDDQPIDQQIEEMTTLENLKMLGIPGTAPDKNHDPFGGIDETKGLPFLKKYLLEKKEKFDLSNENNDD